MWLLRSMIVCSMLAAVGTFVLRDYFRPPLLPLPKGRHSCWLANYGMSFTMWYGVFLLVVFALTLLLHFRASKRSKQSTTTQSATASAASPTPTPIAGDPTSDRCYFPLSFSQLLSWSGLFCGVSVSFTYVSFKAITLNPDLVTDRNNELLSVGSAGYCGLRVGLTVMLWTVLVLAIGVFHIVLAASCLTVMTDSGRAGSAAAKKARRSKEQSAEAEAKDDPVPDLIPSNPTATADTSDSAGSVNSDGAKQRKSRKEN